MKQIPLMLACFLAGAGLAALVVLSLRPPASEDVVVPKPPGAEETPESTPPNRNETPAPPTENRASQAGRSASPAPATAEPPGTAPPDTAGGTPAAENAAGARALPVIRGRVTFATDGAGLSGVPVRVLREGRWFAECLTGGGGTFALGVPGAGRWRVAAFPFGDRGYRPGRDLELGRGEERIVDLVVPARTTVEIAGRVTEEEGNGIPGVTVTAEIPQRPGPANSVAGATGPDGTYALRGLVVSLARPSPRSPREIQDGRFPSHRFVGGRGSARGVSVLFAHPAYGEKHEYVSLGTMKGGRIPLDVTLLRPGWVAGVMDVPGGASVDGAYLSYRFESAHSSTGASVTIEDNRFRIPITRKARLVLGSRIGDFRVADPDLGEVDRNTRKEGVVVRLERFQSHEILLVDGSGLPLGDRASPWAYFEGRGLGMDDVDVVSGKVLLPLPFEEAKTLVISGDGVKERRVKLKPGDLPATVTLEILAPLMTGVVRFPPGFDDFDEVRLHIEAVSGSGRSGVSGGFTGLDRDTGRFTIQRQSDRGPETVYTVTVQIPGYAPWKKEGFRLKEGETLENVEITFEK